MRQELSDGEVRWENFIKSFVARNEAEERLDSSITSLFTDEIDRVALLKKALGKPGIQRIAALFIMNRLSSSELTRLFPDLVFLASWLHGQLQQVYDFIFSLPREWVLSNIEGVAEPLLESGTYEEYTAFLSLYSKLDSNLAVRLAHRAINHPDSDIQEVGKDFVGKLDVTIN